MHSPLPTSSDVYLGDQICHLVHVELQGTAIHALTFKQYSASAAACQFAGSDADMADQEEEEEDLKGKGKASGKSKVQGKPASQGKGKVPAKRKRKANEVFCSHLHAVPRFPAAATHNNPQNKHDRKSWGNTIKQTHIILPRTIASENCCNTLCDTQYLKPYCRAA